MTRAQLFKDFKGIMGVVTFNWKSLDVWYTKSGRHINATMIQPEEWPEIEIMHIWDGDVDIYDELNESELDQIEELL